jgi:uncharacterized Zn-binding protein involved in type VI secretion
MPGPLVTVASTVICPHAIPAQMMPSAPRVMAGGAPVITFADTTLISGCPFMAGNVPMPCVRVQWLMGTTRVLVGGQPAVIQGGTGLAIAAQGSPNGPAQVVQTQPRVVAT